MYYSEVEKWSNLYTNQIGLSISYVYGFRTVKPSETIFHYACIVRDGVWDGTYGKIYCL